MQRGPVEDMPGDPGVDAGEDASSRTGAFRLGTFLSDSRPVLLLFTVIYLVPTVVMASRKLLWDDEFFTLYLSTTSGWSELQRALATGADQHPPLFYYLIHQIVALLGVSHISLRLPSIFGIWLFSVCIFFILRKLTTPAWAVVGLLSPLVTGAYWYAAEARGYALMMGFLSVALLAWLRAADGVRRKLFLVLIAIGFAFAVGSHYYAALALMPIVAGELVRTFIRRKIDWPIWLAFASPLTTIAACLPALQSARKYSSHFWAVPHLSDLFEYYPNALSFSINVIVLAVLLAVLLSIRAAGRMSGVAVCRPFQIWEKAALTGFAILPLVIMIFARTVTHAFVERYAMPALIGALILICYYVAGLARCGSTSAALTILVQLLWFGVMVGGLLKRDSRLREEFRGDLQALIKSGDHPTALAEITVFHALSFYGPRDTVKRFAYLADPASAIKFLGHDTVDRGFLDLRPWFPLNIVPFQVFVAENRSFLVYGYSGDWSWLTFQLMKPDFQSVFVGRIRNRMLLYVERKEANPIAPAAGPVDRLYDRLRVTAPTLCEHYMGLGRCPSLE